METISDLFEISGEFVTQEVSQNLMTLIAEGSGGDEDEDEEADIILRQHSVTIYANLLSKSIAKLPQLLLETMAWVLGEYAYLSEEYTLEEILTNLCDLVRMGKQLAPSTRKIIVSAIMKLVAQAGQCPPQAAKVIDDFTKSKDVDLQQRCLEFQNLITTAPHLLGEVLPVDASCEDVQVDPNLGFLDVFVSQAVADGAKEYEKPEDDDDDDDEYQYSSKKASVFKMTPYEKPTKPGTSFAAGSMGGVGSSSVSSSMAGVTPPPGAYGGNNTQSTNTHVNTNNSHSNNNNTEPQLNVRNVANVWGKGGLTGGGGAPPPAPAPAPSALVAPPVASSTSTSTWSTSYSTSAQMTTTQSESVKSEEQLRKEKMAAALFGGAQSGTPTPTRVARRITPRTTTSRTTAVPSKSLTASASPAPTPPPPAPAPAPIPAPPPEIDLLDLMSDPSPAPALDSGVDILTPSPVVPQSDPEPTPPPPPPTPPAVDLDPFAASGLLDGVTDTPLNALVASDNKFQHNGLTLAPLQITTPQFGEKWGSIPNTSPLSMSSTKCSTLDEFMDLCKSVGAHNVESIPATNEGICAGMLGGTEIVLLHGKVSNSSIDVIIKSTDASIGGCLAMYLQNMVR